VKAKSRIVVIDVEDKGPGMDPHFVRNELFKPLRSTKSRGHGIGAFQAREIVRGAGGDLEVISAPGRGTIMRIVLPRADNLSRRHPCSFTKGCGRMSESRATILVLDDDEGIRTQYRWLLSQHKVLTAGDRLQAVELSSATVLPSRSSILAFRPIQMARAKVWPLSSSCSRSRRRSKIIVVTGNENREYAVKAVASGAYDFFRKPVDPDLLGLIIDRALGVYELEQENRRLVAMAPHIAHRRHCRIQPGNAQGPARRGARRQDRYRSPSARRKRHRQRN
jgi:FixJ family two-component response regulator